MGWVGRYNYLLLELGKPERVALNDIRSCAFFAKKAVYCCTFLLNDLVDYE